MQSRADKALAFIIEMAPNKTTFRREYYRELAFRLDFLAGIYETEDEN